MVKGGAPTLRKTPLLVRIRRRWGLCVLLLIPIVYVFIFNYVPMYGVSIAFMRYNAKQGIFGSPWVGWYQFERFLGNVKFGQIMTNTLALSLYSLVAGFPIPILLALGLTHLRSSGYRKTVQMITYAPYFLSTVIMVALLTQLLNMHSGLLNRFLGMLGIDPINFMGNAKYFRHVYVWSGVWQDMGYGAIIYISALSSVDPQLHEAASIDGASMWKRIWHIDLPSIMPTIVIMLILRMGSLLSVGFEKVFLMQNSTNLSVSEIIETYVYKVGLTATRPDFSYATAVGLFQNVVSFVLVMTANYVASKVSDNGFF
ncbi:ABC transporter permease subunit [Eubacteriales bacterium OttesenSCG-928-A19]|nr:ABC transporter permease subunit [Eubacteriales bacterium OttesenSCG-928-A19]